MRICCLSDLHGNLIQVPDCDLLILAGDLCRNHRDYLWYSRSFKSWIDYNANKCKIVGVAGNHDFIFQNNPHEVPDMNWTYLQDSGTKWNGLNIWGSPWQKRFCDWAFNADEDDMKNRWELIPKDTDILVLHGPPYGYGDKTSEENVGSPSLLEKIKEIKPKLVVAGHIHSGYGIYDIEGTVFVNAALVDERYVLANKPIIIEI